MLVTSKLPSKAKFAQFIPLGFFVSQTVTHRKTKKVTQHRRPWIAWTILRFGKAFDFTKRSPRVVRFEMSAKSSIIRVKPTNMKTRPTLRFTFFMFMMNRLRRREKDMNIINIIDPAKIAIP
jgi:hypothetical protein